MVFEVNKNSTDIINMNYLEQDKLQSEKYFNLTIRKKVFPSCYQYNILIMLAKRLIQEEEKRVNACKIMSASYN